MAKRLGLALSGGGVRGLAHIPVLETLDHAGVRPCVMAGTSMGAVLGALYASGLSGAQIRALVEEHVITRRDGIRQVIRKGRKLLHWADFFRPEWTRRGLLRADRFLKYVLSQIDAECFEDLRIPLSVVATDYHTGTCVVLDRGELHPAIRASMAIPGVFAPVERAGRLLVDGGIVNNMPYDLVQGACDVTLLSDTSSPRAITDGIPPTTVGALQRGFEILMRELGDAKLRTDPPEHRICSELPDVHALDFGRIGEVLDFEPPGLSDLTAWLHGLNA